ncbi:MAG: DUF4412 domain-containing protein, partial [Candidatus Acidiferrum sp.]
QVVTIRQCDLKRTLTVNDATKSYLNMPDVEEGGSKDTDAAAEATAGSVYTSTVKDTGERKKVFGYTARHLTMTIVGKPTANSCSAVKQKYDIDGWYVDLKGLSNCQRFSPYIKNVKGCQDRALFKQEGSAKPGFAILETVTLTNGDDPPQVMTTEVTDIKKDALSADLFDLPADYKQVATNAELYAGPMVTPQMEAVADQKESEGGNDLKMPSPAVMMNPVTGPLAQMAFEQKAMAQAAAMGLGPGTAMPGMGGPTGGERVAAPKQLGPKAAGMIRIGIVAAQAQLGQGSQAGMDYGTPVRNALVQLMSGPAVEIAALDSHIPLQIQAEARQKQCDFILYSNITVKHGGGRGGFGNFMSIAAPLASMAPMAGGIGGAVAGSVASQAASAAAQQAAMSQMSGLTGQIKSKDDVTVSYQLFPTGQSTPKMENSLQAKAKSNGEDVLTPLLTKVATNVLTEVNKK